MFYAIDKNNNNIEGIDINWMIKYKQYFLSNILNNKKYCYSIQLSAEKGCIYIINKNNINDFVDDLNKEIANIRANITIKNIKYSIIKYLQQTPNLNEIFEKFIHDEYFNLKNINNLDKYSLNNLIDYIKYNNSDKYISTLWAHINSYCPLLYNNEDEYIKNLEYNCNNFIELLNFVNKYENTYFKIFI
jgi:hypothetical protein